MRECKKNALIPANEFLLHSVKTIGKKKIEKIISRANEFLLIYKKKGKLNNVNLFFKEKNLQVQST